MKNFAFAYAALMLLAATASAAEPVAKSTLSSMGLGSMQQMSDNDGLAVRGKGTYASVWGGSSANFHGQSSNNNYDAGASWHGKSSGAAGKSFSFAGKIQVSGGADPTGFSVQGSVYGGFAGGGASAHAW
jgi:hypothetical protein